MRLCLSSRRCRDQYLCHTRSGRLSTRLARTNISSSKTSTASIGACKSNYLHILTMLMVGLTCRRPGRHWQAKGRSTEPIDSYPVSVLTVNPDSAWASDVKETVAIFGAFFVQPPTVLGR